MKPADVFREYAEKIIIDGKCPVPVEDLPEPLMDYDTFMIFYREHHESCPKCGGLNIEQGAVEYLYIVGKASEYVDENKASCDCGWVGIVHDLKPEESK